MVTPDQRREALGQVQAKGLSGRAACRWTGLSRTVLRYPAKQPALDQARLAQMREESQRQPRFGYRRVGVLVGLSFKIAWRLWKIGHFRLEKPRLRPLNVRTTCGRTISCMINWPMGSASRP
jgi:putative transposase